MLVATHLAIEYLGATGVYTLAALMGVTDVDPFIMGLTQSTSTPALLQVASAGIVIAAASNHVVKGIYASRCLRVKPAYRACCSCSDWLHWD